MSKLAWVFLDVPPELLAQTRRFWANVLGEEAVVDDDPAYAFFQTPVPVRVGIQAIGEGETRAHLDIAADDVQGEARRLEGLGAACVRDVDDHVIMRDPAGLLFCVVPSRWATGAPLPGGQ